MLDEEPKGNIQSLFDSITKWKQTYDLSFELAEISILMADRLIDYCQKNDIPILQDENLLSLLRKMYYLAKEIENVNSSSFKPLKSPIRRKFTEPKSDKDFTEPETIIF